MKTIKFILLLSLFSTLRAEAEFSPLLPTQTIIKNNWKNLRDLSVVKQNFESSCGGASLATLLTFYYGQTVSEADILKALENNGKKAVSFSEMQKILPQFGFQGQGYAAGYEQLKQLKIPVVVYIKLRGEDHFSVLRGINDDTVLLADSSYGNVTLSKEQFLDVWQTRQNENSDLKGKFLAVLPTKTDIKAADNFFTKQPKKQTDLAIRAIGILRN